MIKRTSIAAQTVQKVRKRFSLQPPALFCLLLFLFFAVMAFSSDGVLLKIFKPIILGIIGQAACIPF